MKKIVSLLTVLMLMLGTASAGTLYETGEKLLIAADQYLYNTEVFLTSLLYIKNHIAQAVCVDGSSMSNTIMDGDVVLAVTAESAVRSLDRGDIVICRYPEREELFVKRLIALPGDTVEIKGGVVYVNGTPRDDSAIDSRISYAGNYSIQTMGEDEYFVLGDNRGNSRDSRYVGPLSGDMLLGKVVCVLWPIEHITALTE